ncbi:hypothetical protein BDF14DRAFT_893867 [Spinellus fusiger]|nr:hypothetical protein BDF14DRAFT_893867 [Spinellus fusiger]
MVPRYILFYTKYCRISSRRKQSYIYKGFCPELINLSFIQDFVYCYRCTAHSTFVLIIAPWLSLLLISKIRFLWIFGSFLFILFYFILFYFILFYFSLKKSLV